MYSCSGGLSSSRGVICSRPAGRINQQEYAGSGSDGAFAPIQTTKRALNKSWYYICTHASMTIYVYLYRCELHARSHEQDYTGHWANISFLFYPVPLRISETRRIGLDPLPIVTIDDIPIDRIPAYFDHIWKICDLQVNTNGGTRIGERPSWRYDSPLLHRQSADEGREEREKEIVRLRDSNSLRFNECHACYSYHNRHPIINIVIQGGDTLQICNDVMTRLHWAFRPRDLAMEFLKGMYRSESLVRCFPSDITRNIAEYVANSKIRRETHYDPVAADALYEELFGTEPVQGISSKE